MARPQEEYALYKGDTFLDIGTAEELAEKYPVKASFVRYSTAPSAVKRYRGKGYIAVKIGK